MYDGFARTQSIREAPLGVVVCSDRRTPAVGVLGRATFPDTDVWSCACAIQNLWLAARADGLGVGWVTLFPPVELGVLLGLPDGVVTLGWLCMGWPDERPPPPDWSGPVGPGAPRCTAWCSVTGGPPGADPRPHDPGCGHRPRPRSSRPGMPPTSY